LNASEPKFRRKKVVQLGVEPKISLGHALNDIGEAGGKYAAVSDIRSGLQQRPARGAGLRNLTASFQS
jgi:hypothetical protein